MGVAYREHTKECAWEAENVAIREHITGCYVCIETDEVCEDCKAMSRNLDAVECTCGMRDHHANRRPVEAMLSSFQSLLGLHDVELTRDQVAAINRLATDAWAKFLADAKAEISHNSH